MLLATFSTISFDWAVGDHMKREVIPRPPPSRIHEKCVSFALRLLYYRTDYDDDKSLCTYVLNFISLAHYTFNLIKRFLITLCNCEFGVTGWCGDAVIWYVGNRHYVGTYYIRILSI